MPAEAAVWSPGRRSAGIVVPSNPHTIAAAAERSPGAPLKGQASGQPAAAGRRVFVQQADEGLWGKAGAGVVKRDAGRFRGGPPPDNATLPCGQPARPAPCERAGGAGRSGRHRLCFATSPSPGDTQGLTTAHEAGAAARGAASWQGGNERWTGRVGNSYGPG
jgi:hypothetical protein